MLSMSPSMVSPKVVRVGVACFVERRDKKILVGRRKGKSHGSGTYQLPGGHLEFGEDFCKLMNGIFLRKKTN